MDGRDGNICTSTICQPEPANENISFLIEGLLTVIVGVFSYGLMPPGATQTAHWFRGKNGWFTEHEEKILVNRILRDELVYTLLTDPLLHG